ncbi:MAG: hypothetical protein V3T59_05540 [Desulfobacterales bacterium]
MKKLLIYLTIFLAAMAVVVYIGSNLFLNFATRKALSLFTQSAPRHGFEVVSSDFRQARIRSLKSAEWKDIALQVIKHDSTGKTQPLLLALDVRSMNLIILSKNSAALEAFMVEGNYDSQTPMGTTSSDIQRSQGLRKGKIWLDYFFMTLDMNLFNPVPGISDLIQQMSTLFNTGITSAHIELAGKIWITLGNKESQIKMKTESTREGTVLTLNRKDLKHLSFYFGERLSEAEIEIVAVNPMIANKLLGIKDYARQTSQKALLANPAVPEDAYRHVLWSYLLTKEFNPDFAEIVTDAHEEGLSGNTPQDRDMDYNNNAVGRKYARLGVLESEIFLMVMRDPKVIRSPQ